MKKVLFFAALVVGVYSCASDPEEEKPENYIQFDSSKVTIGFGELDDDGTPTSGEIDTRIYDIRLANSLSTNASNYFQFTIYSNSTKRLAEGTYNFINYGGDPGDASKLKIGSNIEYDATGSAVSGTRTSSYYMSDVKGTVIVDYKDDSYSFDINLSYKVDGKSHTLKGFYWGTLSANDYLTY